MSMTEWEEKRKRRGNAETRHKSCNERSGTLFNILDYPTDMVLLVVLWRLRYKLSRRDVAEMLLKRGFAFTHGGLK